MKVKQKCRESTQHYDENKCPKIKQLCVMDLKLKWSWHSMLNSKNSSLAKSCSVRVAKIKNIICVFMKTQSELSIEEWQLKQNFKDRKKGIICHCLNTPLSRSVCGLA